MICTIKGFNPTGSKGHQLRWWDFRKKANLLTQNRLGEDAEVHRDIRRAGSATVGFVVRQKRQFRVAKLTIRKVRLH